MNDADVIRQFIEGTPGPQGTWRGNALASLDSLVADIKAMDWAYDQAVARAKAAEQWAKTMEHERDYEQQVVVVDLRERLEAAQAEVADLKRRLGYPGFAR